MTCYVDSILPAYSRLCQALSQNPLSTAFNGSKYEFELLKAFSADLESEHNHGSCETSRAKNMGLCQVFDHNSVLGCRLRIDMPLASL